jgi:hypothetical protein
MPSTFGLLRDLVINQEHTIYLQLFIIFYNFSLLRIDVHTVEQIHQQKAQSAVAAYLRRLGGGQCA